MTVSLTAARQEPDPSVVADLEHTLMLAKAGKLREVAVVGTLAGGDRYTVFSTNDVFAMIASFELIKHRLLRSAPVEISDRGET
jgi:hypothetical protein